MLRAWDYWKRGVHEIETQKNHCLWGKTYLKATKWDECIKEKIGGKFEWKIKVKGNRTLKTFVEISKRKKRNRKLIKHWKNQIRKSLLKSQHKTVNSVLPKKRNGFKNDGRINN
jgi:hypothetical protein